MEAILNGYTAYGSDNDEDAIGDSRKNIDWVQEQFDRTKDVLVEVGTCDARMMHEFWKEPIDAIVTECHLGPLLKATPHYEQIEVIQKDLLTLYRDFFISAKKILKSGGHLVFTSPVHKKKKERIHIKKEWMLNVMDAQWEISPLLESEETILYERPDQIVGRELWRFRRV